MSNFEIPKKVLEKKTKKFQNFYLKSKKYVMINQATFLKNSKSLSVLSLHKMAIFLYFKLYVIFTFNYWQHLYQYL